MAKWTAVMLLLSVLSFFTATAASADIKNAPKLDIKSSSTIIGSEYTFVPQVTSDTELVTFGSSLWRNTKWNSSDSRSFRSIEVTNPTLRNNLKGNIGAKYTNVGFYKGESVDLKITLTNWSRYGLPGTAGLAARVGNISFQTDNIALSTQGFGFVDMTWEYVKSGTNTRLPVSGYFTYSDIDVNQGLEFSAITSANIDRYMIDNRWNRLQYVRTGNSSDRFFDIDDKDRLDTEYDDRYAFTFLYSDLSAFSIRWMTNWSNTTRDGKAVPPDRFYYGNTRDYAAGEYLFFIINKPARTEMPDPVKTVSPGSGFTIDDTLTYNVSHTVPQEDPKFYYSSYVITDTLDSVLTDPYVVIRNSAGRNMNAWFDREVTTNDIKLTAKSSTLNNQDFYGDTYTVEIRGEIDRNELISEIGNGSSFALHNSATVRTNSGTYRSNRVTTNIAKRVLTTRHVDDETGELLDSSTKVMFDGESYAVAPRRNLTNDDGVPYTATSSSIKRGTINGANQTVEFRYTLPNVDVGIEHIQIYTDKVVSGSGTGLPTVVDIAANVADGDLQNSEVELQVVDVTDNVREVYKKSYKVRDFEEPVKFKIPTYYLDKGDKVDYEFRLTTDAGSGLVSTTPKVETHGYTSTEKQVDEDDLTDGSYKESFVILTEKAVDEPAVVEHDETIGFTIPELTPQKTGYGMTATVQTEYENDLNHLVDIKARFNLDTALIDSHLDYPIAGDMTQVDMERTVRSVTSGGSRVTSTLELPFIHVERYTGNLFTNEQAADAGFEPTPPSSPENNPDPVDPPAPVEPDPEPIPDPEEPRDPHPGMEDDDDGPRTPDDPIVDPGAPVGPGPRAFLDRVMDSFRWSNTVSAAEAGTPQYDLVAAGRKLYAPIWAELGFYDYSFTSREAIGVHAVTFEVDGALELYAHMYNHSDSATPEIDELLVHPVAEEDVDLDWDLGVPGE